MMDERRKEEWRAIRRRRRILEATGRAYDYYRHYAGRPDHYYASNPPWNGYAKAPNKTNNKGSRRYISKNYKPNKNWNEHDQRQLDEMEGQMEELDNGEGDTSLES